MQILITKISLQNELASTHQLHETLMDKSIVQYKKLNQTNEFKDERKLIF